jgi:hypothetical protein
LPEQKEIQNTTFPEQHIPPYYNNAQSIKITLTGGTGIGQSRIVERNDTANAMLSAQYKCLFDEILEALFYGKEYVPTSHIHTNDEGHLNFIIYDKEGNNLVEFDLYYMKCVKVGSSWYTVSPESAEHDTPIVDGLPFYSAFLGE